ncbi:MAG: bifunctional dihydroneopterin aldolase/7,8-dihydroneopterin epimerase [Candidatus Dasytiphilus stammeri]
MDIIFIEQLCIITTIGVYKWEQNFPQKLIFDIEMGWDHHKAGESDDVKDCLNYQEISAIVINHVTNSKFSLIERVAEEIATLLLKSFASPWVRIKISKPCAVAQACKVGVIIERRRSIK